MKETTRKKQRIEILGNTLGSKEVPCIIDSLRLQGNDLAGQAIFAFIVVQGVPLSIVNTDEFRKMIAAVRNAGSGYMPPNRHAFGMDTRAGNDLGLGNLLSRELLRLRHHKLCLISWWHTL